MDITMNESNLFFKLLLIGDGGVGKTALAKRYLTGLFTEDTKITIGAGFYSHHLELGGHQVMLQIWDFGGEEQFRFLLPGYCRGARGVIFMHDVTNPATLFHYDTWLDVLRGRASGIPVLAVGTKIDLEDARATSFQEAEEYTRARGAAGYMEVSAKTGVNVGAAFDLITKIMMANL